MRTSSDSPKMLRRSEWPRMIHWAPQLRAIEALKATSGEHNAQTNTRNLT
jgi:hypothetical protein